MIELASRFDIVLGEGEGAEAEKMWQWVASACGNCPACHEQRDGVCFVSFALLVHCCFC